MEPHFHALATEDVIAVVPQEQDDSRILAHVDFIEAASGPELPVHENCIKRLYQGNLSLDSYVLVWKFLTEDLGNQRDLSQSDWIRFRDYFQCNLALFYKAKSEAFFDTQEELDLETERTKTAFLYCMVNCRLAFLFQKTDYCENAKVLASYETFDSIF